MATVRVSEHLRDECARLARKMFDSRIDAVIAASPMASDTWGDTLYARVFGDDLQLMNNTHHKWGVEVSRMQIDFANNSEQHYLPTGPKLEAEARRNVQQNINILTWSVTLPMSCSRMFPKEVTPQEFVLDSKSWLAGGLTVNGGHPDIADFIDALKPTAEKLHNILDQRLKFVRSVDTVLLAHPTVNSALKTWPGLLAVLPDTIKARLLEKATRAKPAAVGTVATPMSLDHMTAEITRARLTGGM